jgi:hypothetical protein
MKFEMTTPCDQCPFTTGPKAVRLSVARAREIYASITTYDAPFPCHKTLDYDDDDAEEDADVCVPADAQHCAGAMIMLERMNRPNQMMRIAERLGLYDRSRLQMTAPVFADEAAMLAAQWDAREVSQNRRQAE